MIASASDLYNFIPALRKFRLCTGLEVDGMQDVPKIQESAAGLELERLTAGALVTLSPNKVTGDRSLSYAIWEIVSTNDRHALLKCRGFGDWVSESMNTRLVLLEEYDFYPAENLTPPDDPPKRAH